MEKYIYIDDDNEKIVSSIIAGLNDTGLINIERLEFVKGTPFEELINLIKTAIDNGANGILLDLCLDGEGENKLMYSASPIAQHIRSLAAKEDIKDVAIVLCSTKRKLAKTYDSDRASHDLFDYKFRKDGDIKWVKVANKMNTIAEAYSRLGEYGNNLNKLIDREDTSYLDNRVFERFECTKKKFSSYEFINFLIKDLFQHPGILIKESVVAARFGIDMYKSGDWETLKGHINNAKYNGVIKDGWNRYWADMINDSFENISDGQFLQTLNAKERVEVLKDKLQLNSLKVADPIQFCQSTYYGTICEATKQPLDPMEGYEVYESYELRPWQEPKYISFYAHVSGRYPNITIKGSEIQRFENYRKELENEGE